MLSESRMPVSSSTTSTLGLDAIGHERLPGRWRPIGRRGVPAVVARLPHRNRFGGGRITVKRVPACCYRRTRVRGAPRWRGARRRDRGPLPFAFVVKNGSNMRSRISAGMPGPASVTRESTPCRLRGACPTESGRRRPRTTSMRTSPPVGRRLHRVEREVEDRAVQQILVAFDANRPSPSSTSRDTSTVGGDRDARRRGLPRRARRRAEVDRLRARHAHAREVEELGEESRQTIGLAHHEDR